ncbi:helix-turn-helix domain-containing protein [Nocardia terrae]|nr:helix-turn-helix transcriptional regulator [Nocardia terrae]
MAGRTGDFGKRSGITLPTFGDLLRRLREDRGASRERLAFGAGVSASYITQLEKGGKGKPTQAVVAALVRCLERWKTLSATELRHLQDLAGLAPQGYPTVEELRNSLGEDALRTLAMHRPNLAALYDTRGNVLAGNEDWAAAFPGLREDGNLYRWMFADPVARHVLYEWEFEVRQAVGWLRGMVGAAPDPAGFDELMAELGRFPAFRAFWCEGGVGFAPPVRTLRLRDRNTDVVRQIRVQVGLLRDTVHVGHIIATVGLLPG